MKIVIAVFTLFCSVCSSFAIPIIQNRTVDGRITFDKRIPDEVEDNNIFQIQNGTFEKRIPDELFLDINPSWLFEGDIALPSADRKIVTNASNLWPNHNIPFIYDSSVSFSDKRRIRDGIKVWSIKTGITFTNKGNDISFNTSNDHVLFRSSEDGCWSHVGKIGGQQPLNIGKRCKKPETIVHLIGHLIGFGHEHSRSDRDDYVTILTNNIKSDRIGEFNYLTSNDYGVPYDYTSIMHYPSEAYSDPQYEVNTIRSIDPRYQYVMGSGELPSFRDVKRAMMAYYVDDYVSNCPEVSSSDTCNEGYLKKDCTCKCPDGLSGDNCEIGTETEGVPCGEEITTEGYYWTPEFPARSSDRMQRMCVYQIKAPAANQRISVYFEHFVFQPRYNHNGNAVCYWEAVEVRKDGTNSEGEFKCGTELQGQTEKSVNDEMVILINVRRVDRFLGYGKGMKFSVEFLNDTTTTEGTASNECKLVFNKESTTTKEATTTDATTTTEATTTEATTTTEQRQNNDRTTIEATTTTEAATTEATTTTEQRQNNDRTTIQATTTIEATATTEATTTLICGQDNW